MKRYLLIIFVYISALTIAWFSDMKVRFGCELELFLTNSNSNANGLGTGADLGFSRKDIAFNLSQAGIIARDERYTKNVTDHWKIVTDSSLVPSAAGDLPFELVSPILCSEAGVAAARKAILTLSKMGIYTNKSAGLHLHIDGAYFSLQEMKNLTNNWLMCESAIEACVPPQRRAERNRFAKSNRSAFGKSSSKQRFLRISEAQTFRHLRHICNPDNSKYWKLNLCTLDNASPTVEFRLAGGSDEPRFLEFYIRFIIAFCTASKTKAIPYSVNSNDTLTSRDEVNLLLELLSSYRKVCDMYLSKVAEMGGVEINAWRCFTCNKTFDRSRQLLQHRKDSQRCFRRSDRSSR
mmetsp:Transcript_11864/g.13749  ORF Transcript_11864/g.13749 Transcript_11864/m.13749 type:complete len:350 (+) Transcript_11864:521-1570(+)